MNRRALAEALRRAADQIDPEPLPSYAVDPKVPWTQEFHAPKQAPRLVISERRGVPPSTVKFPAVISNDHDGGVRAVSVTYEIASYRAFYVLVPDDAARRVFGEWNFDGGLRREAKA